MKIYIGGPNVQHPVIRSSLPKLPAKRTTELDESGRTDLDSDRTSSSFWTVLRPSRRNIADTKFRGKLRAEETSFFTNVELLNRRASKNVMLPKRPSEQSKTSSNYGRATYSTHSSLGINSSTTSFFKICRSIFTARGLTTKLMFDQSSLYFESCQAWFEHSNFIKVTAPEARPDQLRPGAYRRQKRQADRCSPKADRATHPKDQPGSIHKSGQDHVIFPQTHGKWEQTQT
ncbi:hypothetical protein YC2023_108584 [Brassica napus]